MNGWQTNQDTTNRHDLNLKRHYGWTGHDPGIDSATSTSPTPSAGTLELTLPSHGQSHFRRS